MSIDAIFFRNTIVRFCVRHSRPIYGSAPRQDSGLKDGCVQEQQKSADPIGVGQTLGTVE